MSKKIGLIILAVIITAALVTVLYIGQKFLKYEIAGQKKGIGIGSFSSNGGLNLLESVMGTVDKETGHLNFPKDHNAHSSFQTEWWYFNFLIQTENKENSGYVLSFSRINNHYALLSSKYNYEKNSFKEATHLGNLTVSSGLNINFQGEGNINVRLKKVTNQSYKLTGYTPEIGNISLDLMINKVDSPLLWGCDGLISVFSTDDTNYYSLPDIDVLGTIDSKKITLAKGWMDHQWFSSTPPSDWKGHYWFNIHTNNGEHMAFVTQVYNSGQKYTYWIKRNSNGDKCSENGKAYINSFWPNQYPKTASFRFGANSIGNYTISEKQVFQPPLVPKFFEPVSYFYGKIDNKSFKGFGFFETSLKNQNLNGKLDYTTAAVPKIDFSELK